MLRVAVVEDETEYRGLIQVMVGRYAKEYDLQIQITALEISRRNRPAFLSAVVDFLGG